MLGTLHFTGSAHWAPINYCPKNTILKEISLENLNMDIEA